jgi:hypothetical protein
MRKADDENALRRPEGVERGRFHLDRKRAARARCIDETGAHRLARIPSVAASTGSASHTGDLKLSPVLEAMGVAREAGRGAIRFSLRRWTTLAEIDETVALLRCAIS